MNDFHIKLSFRKKLLLSFIVLSFIPVLLIGITTYKLYNRFITNMMEKSSIETIDLVCNDIDSLLNDTWQLCDALTRDIKIQENLRMKFDSVSSQYSLDLSGSMDMASISTYRKDIFGVYVLGENGGRYKSNYYSFKPDDPRDSEWYQKIKNSPETTWFSPHEGSFVVRSSIEDRFISVGLPSSDKATGRINGVICADIKEDDLTKKIQDSLNNGAIYLLDDQGNILFQSGNNSHFPVSFSDELTGQILPGYQRRGYPFCDHPQQRVSGSRPYIRTFRLVYCRCDQPQISGTKYQRADHDPFAGPFDHCIFRPVYFPAYLPVCIPPHSDSLYYDGGGRSRGFFRSLFGASRR